MTRDELVARFEKNVIRRGADECWDWGKPKSRDWYGQANFDGFVMLAHRISFEIHHGPIPEGMEVCHECDNKGCCNPKHLFLGTHKDNMDDRDAKNRVRHGETHPVARLTEADVIRIRELAGQDIPMSIIAQDYGLKPRSIYKVVHGDTWARVPGALPKDFHRWRLRKKWRGASEATRQFTASVNWSAL